MPYKGASDLVTAVLSNQVVFGMPIFAAAHPMAAAGKLRLLAIASRKRNPIEPQVPTLGVAGVELPSWDGLSVPAGTSDAVVQTLFDAFSQALGQPAVVDALMKNGGQVDIGDAAAFEQTIRREMQLTAAMMQRVQLEPI